MIYFLQETLHIYVSITCLFSLQPVVQSHIDSWWKSGRGPWDKRGGTEADDSVRQAGRATTSQAEHKLSNESPLRLPAGMINPTIPHRRPSDEKQSMPQNILISFSLCSLARGKNILWSSKI